MKGRFQKDELMAPLWIMYPHIPNGSIGWRMGYGENYAIDFYEWFYKLTDEKKQKYKEWFPEPKIWRKGDRYTNNQYWICLWNQYGITEYGINDLLVDYKQGKSMDYLFFWGHHPSKNGEITKSCLSQWWESSFQVGHLTYKCMEQYMMFEKARLFQDREIEQLIMNCNVPKEIKSLGRKVKNFDETIWNEVKYTIVVNGNYYKFMGNSKLRKFLLSTQEKILVEASPYDAIWGIKMDERDLNSLFPEKWQGENLLGFALMEVRNEIKRVCKNIDLINLDRLHEKYD